jgi:hypothetical protein
MRMSSIMEGCVCIYRPSPYQPPYGRTTMDLAWVHGFAESGSCWTQELALGSPHGS